jgi:molybdenum cofactor synthesis domain-containing protein
MQSSKGDERGPAREGSPPHAEIVIVGTEIVMGRIQDTNSSWLAARLAQLGFFIDRITAVPDRAAQLEATLREALARAPDVLIVAGGMGPTEDDITVACVARVLGLPLVLHEPTVEHLVRRRNLPDRSHLSPGALKMATVPQGSLVGQNPAGSAPALELHAGRTALFVLPGPPKELTATFEAHVLPALRRSAQRRTCSVRVAVQMHESEVAPLMEKISHERKGVYLKALVSLWGAEGYLPVDIVAASDNEEHARALVQQVLQEFTRMVEAAGRHWRLLEEEPSGS